ncbi:MAG: HYR domain-containing protein [Gemmatimonadaceae bacterium]
MRPTLFANLVRPFGTALASAFALTIVLSCSDSTAPVRGVELDPNNSIVVFVPDSVKAAEYAAMGQALGTGSLRSNLMTGDASAAPAAGPVSLVAGARPYSFVEEKNFAPEAAPSNIIPNLSDDGLYPAIPLGFDFEFYGQTYSSLNVYYNGFITFGSNIPKDSKGVALPFYTALNIADPTNPNNMIALAWNDWNPGKVQGSVRFETRGSAPNRVFVLQFTAVPEVSGSGKLTSQMVLYEGSNKIRISTTSMTVTNSGHRVTQGIENEVGNQAMYDSVQQPVLKTWSPRVRNFFNLTNDAVTFSPPQPNRPPVVIPPGNISVASDATSCAAVVDAGNAGVSDDADGATVVGVRSDDASAPLNGTYPQGVTTITWTATDVEGATSTATQLITVTDNQNPTITAPANISVRDEQNTSRMAIDVGVATAFDNCPEVVVNGSRSDGAPVDAFYPDGITTITWTAKDAAGNTSSASQTITVIANQPPVFTFVPVNMNADTGSGVCSALVDVGTATASDDAPGVQVSGARSDNLALSAAYPKGVTTITWTAEDAGHLTTTATQTVNVSDRESPVVTAPASVVVGTDPGIATAVVNVGNASLVRDNCHDATVSSSRSDGRAMSAPFPLGLTVVTWSASDLSGNSVSATQVVTVEDREAPVFGVSIQSNMTVDATSPAGAVVTYPINVTDNVGVTSASCSPASGSLFTVGNTTVACNARDAAGNTATRSFIVTVRGAKEQRASLMDYLVALNLPNGTAQPLINQLRAVENDANACKKMSDFIDMLSKKTGNIDADAVRYMTAESRDIMAAMGCGGTSSTTTKISAATSERF